jgi:para-nitrobenzyl esterase
MLAVFDVYRGRFGSVLTAAGDRRSARRVSRDIQSRWRSFSRSGVPGDDWPAYDAAERAVMVFDRRSRVEFDPHPDRRTAWEGFTLTH